jgi:hypothetical protein
VMVFIPMRHAGRIFVQITAELSGCCGETFKRNLSSRDSTLVSRLRLGLDYDAARIIVTTAPVEVKSVFQGSHSEPNDWL